MMDIDSDSAGVRLPPPLLFIGTLVVGLAAGGFAHFRVPFRWGITRDLGWFALVAGLAILLTAIGLFHKAGTDPKPWKRVSAFVTDGVYRWTRNPMYLGMTLIYAGAALIADSLVALLLLVPLIVYIQREVIEREEAYMESRFGASYLAYKASVRRWI